MDMTTTAPASLDLGIEELEEMVAPMSGLQAGIALGLAFLAGAAVGAAIAT